GMCATQSKDHLTLRATIFKSELSEPSSYPFATNCHHSQRARHDKCFRTFEKNFDVDNHTKANQEERYENRITNKLNPVHKCRRVRNELVQGQPRNKSTNNRFESGYLSDKGSKKNNEQNKYIMRCFFTLYFLEKPFGNPRYDSKHNGQKHGKRKSQPHPKLLIKLSL